MVAMSKTLAVRGEKGTLDAEGREGRAPKANRVSLKPKLPRP